MKIKWRGAIVAIAAALAVSSGIGPAVASTAGLEEDRSIVVEAAADQVSETSSNGLPDAEPELGMAEEPAEELAGEAAGPAEPMGEQPQETPTDTTTAAIEAADPSPSEDEAAPPQSELGTADEPTQQLAQAAPVPAAELPQEQPQTASSDATTPTRALTPGSIQNVVLSDTTQPGISPFSYTPAMSKVTISVVNVDDPEENVAGARLELLSTGGDENRDEAPDVCGAPDRRLGEWTSMSTGPYETHLSVSNFFKDKFQENQAGWKYYCADFMSAPEGYELAGYKVGDEESVTLPSGTTTVKFPFFVMAVPGEEKPTVSLPLDMTFYVRPLVYFTVSFDLNGGTGNFPDIVVTAGDAVMLPTAIPSRDDYTFEGWLVSLTGSDEILQPGTAFTPPTDVTLVAQWSPDPVDPTDPTDPAGPAESGRHSDGSTTAAVGNRLSDTGARGLAMGALGAALAAVGAIAVTAARRKV